MKKWLFIFPVLALMIFQGGETSPGTDIGKLQPVQVVCLSRKEDGLVIRTDTGDWGEGQSLEEAVACMKAVAKGEIFLETAEYLLLTPDCLFLVEQSAEYLRPSCSLCLLEGEPLLETVAQFLQMHNPAVTLMEYRAQGSRLKTLKTADGRMELVS